MVLTAMMCATNTGNAVFSVKGRLAWGHLLEIYDNMGNKVGVLKEKSENFPYI